MKRLILVSVLALVTGAALWHLLQRDPGYILIVAGGKTIEMRFAFAVVLLLVALVLLLWLRKLLRKTRYLLRGGWAMIAAARRERRADVRTNRGLLHFLEGDWKAARQDLLKAARLAPRPLLQYLGAARSAAELGREQEARELLAKAQQLAPRQDLAVTLSQAQTQLALKQYEACLATLHRAKTLDRGHPVVLDLLHRVYLALGDWASLELLLPELYSRKVLNMADMEKLEQDVIAARLDQVARAATTDRPDSASPSPARGRGVRGEGGPRAALEDLWRRAPKALRCRPQLLTAYARGLLATAQFDEAESLLRRALKDHWSETLVELYGLVPAPNRQAQLQTAQKWLAEHPSDPVLHLALARLCLRNELWGQAREHLQQSLDLRATPTAFAELARLSAQLGDTKMAAQCYQQGLLLVTRLPSLPLPGKPISSAAH